MGSRYPVTDVIVGTHNLSPTTLCRRIRWNPACVAGTRSRDSHRFRVSISVMIELMAAVAILFVSLIWRLESMLWNGRTHEAAIPSCRLAGRTDQHPVCVRLDTDQLVGSNRRTRPSRNRDSQWQVSRLERRLSVIDKRKIRKVGCYSIGSGVMTPLPARDLSG